MSACGRGGEWKDLGPEWICGQGLSMLWRWRRWRTAHSAVPGTAAGSWGENHAGRDTTATPPGKTGA